ncbi:MAG: hypothetical protein ACD_54C00212G0001, partial [uncultured bacterium]
MAKCAGRTEPKKFATSAAAAAVRSVDPGWPGAL